MSQAPTRRDPAEFPKRAVQRAVASGQPIAQTARDRGGHEHTLHPWSGTSARAERQEQAVNDAHRYEELKRLRNENPRVQEAREI